MSARKVIRHGNFLAVDDLHEKLANFIDFFNDKLAKPFRWTYTGKPLAARLVRPYQDFHSEALALIQRLQ
jgi:hypothetical protein